MNLSIILYVHIDLITTIYQTLKVAFIFIENVTQYIFFSLNSSRSSSTLLPTQLHILSLSGEKKKNYGVQFVWADSSTSEHGACPEGMLDIIIATPWKKLIFPLPESIVVNSSMAGGGTPCPPPLLHVGIWFVWSLRSCMCCCGL